MPDWWEEVVEKTRGHEGLPKDWFDSTLALFVLYAMTFSDWVDEFALYNYRMLLASVRCFDECRGLPYNFVQSTATEGRCDDRGSIGYCRMIRGAILYRVFNCLSTFSRWGAVKALAAKMNKTIFTTGHWIQLPTSLLGRSSPIWSIFNIIVNYLAKVRSFVPRLYVEDSLFSFALFGPGARKGAYIVDGGAPAILEFDQLCMATRQNQWPIALC